MASYLQAPWRMQYIKAIDKPEGDAGCFLCAAAATAESDIDQRKGRLVLWTSEHCVAVINLYPYTNGHLLIAPKAHKADLELLTPEESNDLIAQTIRAVALLKKALSPQGFNLGINLGRVAGAGVPGHLHQHIVPRWNGDVNFMTVVGDIRVVPEAADQLYDQLLNTLPSIR
jgi:ATP adenylyltransferase